MKTIHAKTLRDVYNMSRKWIVKGKDTPLSKELNLTLDEDSNLVTVELGDEQIIDKNDEPSLFDSKGDTDESSTDTQE